MTDAARGAGNESNLAVELHGTRSLISEMIVNDFAGAKCHVCDTMRRRERHGKGAGARPRRWS